MDSKIKLRIVSVAATGVFCLLAAGSMESSSSNNQNTVTKSEVLPHPDPVQVQPATPSLSIALECVDPKSASDIRYFYYGDSVSEFFRLEADGKVGERVAVTLDDTSDSKYSFSCRNLDPAVSFESCNSFVLRRDSLDLTNDERLNSAALAQESGSSSDSYTFSCHKMDKDDASKVLAKRESALQHEGSVEEQKKADQQSNNQL
jgi:hypothetical protein